MTNEERLKDAENWVDGIEIRKYLYLNQEVKSSVTTKRWERELRSTKDVKLIKKCLKFVGNSCLYHRFNFTEWVENEKMKRKLGL